MVRQSRASPAPLVIITRPAGQGAEFAAQAARVFGADRVIVSPLMMTEYLPIVPRLAEFAALVLTSPAAVEAIRREAEIAREGRRGRIIAKMNSLIEPQIVRALYEAFSEQRLLTLADYANPYLTMSAEYEAATLEVFGTLRHWGEVTGRVPVRTRRLDDIGEIERLDFLKMDVQGSELAVLRHGRGKLAQAVAARTDAGPSQLAHTTPVYVTVNGDGSWVFDLEGRLRLLVVWRVDWGATQATSVRMKTAIWLSMIL